MHYGRLLSLTDVRYKSFISWLYLCRIWIQLGVCLLPAVLVLNWNMHLEEFVDYCTKDGSFDLLSHPKSSNFQFYDFSFSVILDVMPFLCLVIADVLRFRSNDIPLYCHNWHFDFSLKCYFDIFSFSEFTLWWYIFMGADNWIFSTHENIQSQKWIP